MTSIRPLLAIALVVPVAAAGAASAATKAKPKPKPAPKPVCNLVTDPANDASFSGGPGDAGLEIVGADIASNAKALTAVIRLKSAKASDLGNVGRDVQLTFDAKGAVAPIWIGYGSSAYGGDAFQYGVIGQGTGGSTSPTGDAQGVVDTAKNEIRMTVPLSALQALGNVKPGAKLSNLTVTASQVVGVAPNPSGVYAYSSEEVDSAAGKSYVAGYPSCVKVG